MSSMLDNLSGRIRTMQRKEFVSKKKSLISSIDAEFESRSMCLFHDWIWIDNVKNVEDFCNYGQTILALSELESLEWSGPGSNEFELPGAHDVYRRYLIKMSSCE